MSPEEKKLLYEIKDDLKKINAYLYNDELTGTPGAIQNLNSLNMRVTKLEETNKIEAAKKALLLFLGGIIVTISQYLFKIVTNGF